MRHIPTVNIVDIANTIAPLGLTGLNALVPVRFHPDEHDKGRIAPLMPENVKSAS